MIRRPGANGEVRVLELDHPLNKTKDNAPLLDNLLQNDDFAKELQQLSPPIRGKIVGTLRRIQIPEVKVRVQSSQ